MLRFGTPARLSRRRPAQRILEGLASSTSVSNSRSLASRPRNWPKLIWHRRAFRILAVADRCASSLKEHSRVKGPRYDS